MSVWGWGEGARGRGAPPEPVLMRLNKHDRPLLCLPPCNVDQERKPGDQLPLKSERNCAKIF